MTQRRFRLRRPRLVCCGRLGRESGVYGVRGDLLCLQDGIGAFALGCQILDE
jgi:hypothetical protein